MTPPGATRQPATGASTTVLALDFDGVLCDSRREVLLVGLQAYLDLLPHSRLGAQLHALEGCQPSSGDPLAADPLLSRFQTLTPLGNRAEDFGVALQAIDQGIGINDQAGYDSFFGEQDRQWLDDYHRRFYERRAALREADPERWLDLQPPFATVIELLQRRARCQDPTLAVATAKDGHSVRLLLERYGISDLIRPELLLDKETGVKKTAHLQGLARIVGCSLAQITFVDDKVNHLVAVAGLGVRCVLAGWGFNSRREHELAKDLGFPVATLATAEALLFGTPRAAGHNHGAARL